jgi:hypothetical protein
MSAVRTISTNRVWGCLRIKPLTLYHRTQANLIDLAVQGRHQAPLRLRRYQYLSRTPAP